MTPTANRLEPCPTHTVFSSNFPLVFLWEFVPREGERELGREREREGEREIEIWVSESRVARGVMLARVG
jgi:hypothetical protein